jgi:hypothetical protein
MLYLLCIGILTGMFVSMYHLEGHLVVYNSVSNRKAQILKLVSVVSTQHKNIITIIWMTMCLIAEALYISLIQRLNKSVKRIDNKTFEITYFVGGRLYKMRVTPKRGPSPVMQISNENQEDVTDQILPYMGPSYNWHNNTFSPACFGHQTLVFEFMDGTETAFEEKNVVDLTKVD